MEQHVSALSSVLPGKVYLPGGEQYAESLNTYFSAQESQIQPACIVQPHSSADVVAAISYLVSANHRYGIGSLKFAIRSGGHACFAGSANVSNGVTIDLRRLDSIEIVEDSSLVWIGAGASWGEVYRTLDPMNLAVPGGRHSQVGVSGLTLGGGLSHFSGDVGLVCDNVVEYEIVLPSSAVVRVKEEDPEYGELFRALRGGSNNFGIVTRFKFRTIRQGRLWGGTLIHPIEIKDQQLQAFYDFSTSPSYDSNASLIHSVGMSAERGSGFVNSFVYTKPDSEPTVFKPFSSLEPAYLNTLRTLSLTELTREQDSFNQNGLCQIMIATTYYVQLPLLHQTFDLWQSSYDAVKDYSGIVWSMSFQPMPPIVIVRSPFLREAIPTLSAKTGTVVVAQLTGTWKEPKDTAAIEPIALKLIDDIDDAARKADMQTGYIYLNYAHPGQKVFGEGKRISWLQDISRKYDPDSIFQRCVPGGFKLF